jgi:DNA-binding SARP family transcriptional activator
MGSHEQGSDRPMAPTGGLAIFFFGRLRLIYQQQPFAFVALPRTSSLLAYLLLHQGEALARADLAFMLWPDVPEDVARANLRRHMYDLQRTLPPPPDGQKWFHSSTRMVTWPSRPDLWFDVAQFTLMLDQGQAAGAVALYSDELLPHLDDEWLAPLRARLHKRCTYALEQLMVASQASGAYQIAINYAHRLHGLDPLNETAIYRLMNLYALTGNRGAAVKAYHDFARQLSDELGIEPLPETQTLYSQIVHDMMIGPVSDASAPRQIPAVVTQPATLLERKVVPAEADESLAIKRRLGDILVVADTLNKQAITAQKQAQFASAEMLYVQALEHYQQVGSEEGIALVLHNLGELALLQDDNVAAEACFRESLRMRCALGDREGMRFNLWGLAAVAQATGQPLKAARIWGAEETLREDLGATIPPGHGARSAQRMEMARNEAAAGAFAEAWNAGRVSPLEHLLSELLEE